MAMKTSLTARVSARPRRIALLIALTGALVLGVMQIKPASAYTVEHNQDKILITSERLHANTVRATVSLALYPNGNYEFKVELHNGARIAKTYRVGGEVRVPGMFLVFSYDSGQHDIEGKRNDDWDTIYGYGHDHRLSERWSAVDMGNLEAHFWLGASWNSTHEDKNRWVTCGASVCEM
jgi:hypothetical protein